MDFIYKYSDYNPDRFKDSKYLELSDALLKLTKNDDERKMMESILTQGGVENYSVNEIDSYMNHKNPLVESRKR